MVGFESEGFEHLCSCLLHLVHRCALHEDLWKLKACELVTLGSLDPRRPCGGWDPWWSLVAVREPPIPLWVVPRIVVERLRISASKDSDSGRWTKPLWCGSLEKKVKPLWLLNHCVGSHLSNETYSLNKEELGNTSSSPRASVISIPGLFTYALYIVIVFVLEVFYIAITLLLVLLSISCWCT